MTVIFDIDLHSMYVERRTIQTRRDPVSVSVTVPVRYPSGGAEGLPLLT